MAIALRGLVKLNLGLVKPVFSKPNFINVGVRFMYMERDLGISAYENTRFIYRNQFMSIEDTFRAKMKEVCQNENGIVFTEDLKAMIHLAQPTEEDMQLIIDMLLKFNKFKTDHQFGSYVFGSVIMRMFYYLNEPKIAMATFKNPELAETFSYHSAVRTLLCLLYKHNMYDEMRDIYETVKNLKGVEFITSNNILLYAACLKQNTSESAQYAINEWRAHCKIRIPSARATGIVSYLAIKHNAPEEAMEMLSITTRDNSIAVRCLKVLALTSLGKYLSIIPILKYSAEQEITLPHKYGFFADVIYELQEKLREENAVEYEQILSLIEKLKRQQRIETDKTLEEFLLRPLISPKTIQQRESTKVSMNYPTAESRVGLKNYM